MCLGIDSVTVVVNVTFHSHTDSFSSAALNAYFTYNRSLPSRIIVYRDGVGDGMLHSVVNYEVPQIMQSIKAMGKDYA